MPKRTDIESIAVYGGEDASPAVYGKVYIAVKPVGDTAFSTATKDAITNPNRPAGNLVSIAEYARSCPSLSSLTLGNAI